MVIAVLGTAPNNLGNWWLLSDVFVEQKGYLNFLGCLFGEY